MSFHAPQDALQKSPVVRQLQRGFPWLRFEPELEAQYRGEYWLNLRRPLRFNLIIALVLLLAFMQLDNVVLPDAADRVMNLVRYALLIPVVLLAIGATFLPLSSRWFGRSMTALVTAALIIVAVLIVLGWSYGQGRLFSGLMLATIFSYLLLGLTPYSALLANSLALLAYAIAGGQVQMPGVELGYNIGILAFCNVLAAITAYSLDRGRRQSWLESKLLDEVSQRDGLTGIFNRRRLDEHLQRVWQQGTREQRPMALLMTDIDCFKAYNDRYGHQAGDEALKAVAGVLAQSARRPLDFVARYGGEEFVVILYDTTKQYAIELAEQILAGVRALRIQHSSSTALPVLSVSIGVAFVIPTTGRRAEGFVQLADQALYAAKDAGRNRRHVHEAEYEQMKTGYFTRELPTLKGQ